MVSPSSPPTSGQRWTRPSCAGCASWSCSRIRRASERAALWQRAFPARTPTLGIDIERLAQLTATGGMIRNIALNAACSAAGRGSPVTMSLILEMARIEFRKLELPVGEQEFRWAEAATSR